MPRLAPPTNPHVVKSSCVAGAKVGIHKLYHALHITPWTVDIYLVSHTTVDGSEIRLTS